MAIIESVLADALDDLGNGAACMRIRLLPLGLTRRHRAILARASPFPGAKGQAHILCRYTPFALAEPLTKLNLLAP